MQIAVSELCVGGSVISFNSPHSRLEKVRRGRYEIKRVKLDIISLAILPYVSTFHDNVGFNRPSRFPPYRSPAERTQALGQPNDNRGASFVIFFVNYATVCRSAHGNAI